MDTAQQNKAYEPMTESMPPYSTTSSPDQQQVPAYLSPPPFDPSAVYVEPPHSRHIARMIVVSVLVVFLGIVGYLLVTNSGRYLQGNAGVGTSHISTTPSASQVNQAVVPTHNATTAEVVAEVTVMPSATPSLQAANSVAIGGAQTTGGAKVQLVGSFSGYAVGKSVDITVKAQTGDANITGYDVLIAYDAQEIEIDAKSVISSLQNFNVYSFKKKGYITVTAVKKAKDTTVTQFHDTNLFTFTMKPLKAGMVNLHVSPMQGRETTKFVDLGMHVLKPQKTTFSVQVK